jgi:ABC-type bacteriocin/lantibiotic exporter with double-glycine peptidase domain
MRAAAGVRVAALGVAVATAAVGVVAIRVARRAEPARVLMAGLSGARFHEVGTGVLQRFSNDCGPAALAHCLRRLGREAPYPDPESRVRIGPRGCSLGELAEEASRRGWEVVVRRIEVAELARVAPPAILHLRPGHFVVFEGWGADGRCRGHDPAVGAVSWSRWSLGLRWGGEILHGAPEGEAGPVGRSPPK